MRRLLYVFVMVLFSHNLMADGDVVVTIDFAGAKPTKIVKAELKSGMTALALLQSVAEVKTKQVGKFTFITSIDGVQSTPRKKGWFYKVDGKKAKKVASDYVLEDIKKMNWKFKADNCLSR